MATKTLRKVLFDLLVKAKQTGAIEKPDPPLAGGLELFIKYAGGKYQIAASRSPFPKQPSMTELMTISAESPAWINFGQWDCRANDDGKIYQIVDCTEVQPKSSDPDEKSGATSKGVQSNFA